MADGTTPGTETSRVLLRDQDAVHSQRRRTWEASPSPVSDDEEEVTVTGEDNSYSNRATAGRGEEVTVTGEDNSDSNRATAGRTEAVLIKDQAKVPDQPFRLMDLPLELRSMIFRELLVMPGPVLFASLARKKPAPFARADLIGSDALHRVYYGDSIVWHLDFNLVPQSGLLNIFSASKTVYRETVPLYYRCNQFHFENLDFMEQFLNKVGAESRWQISTIAVNYHGKAPARAVKRLTACVGLRRLTLNLDSLAFARLDPNNPRDTRLIGMKDLLRIRGLDRIDLVSLDEESLFLPITSLSQNTVINNLKERLKVLKEAHDPKQLKRQEKKDFPTKAKRTIFGAANVLTRSERQMLDTQH